LESKGNTGLACWTSDLWAVMGRILKTIRIKIKDQRTVDIKLEENQQRTDPTPVNQTFRCKNPTKTGLQVKRRTRQRSQKLTY